jgi:hypothetical protein
VCLLYLPVLVLGALPKVGLGILCERGSGVGGGLGLRSASPSVATLPKVWSGILRSTRGWGVLLPGA